MAWYDPIVDRLGRSIAGFLAPTLEDKAKSDREYYNGEHPEQLKTKPGQYNDNVAMNYIGLAIERAISRTFNGLTFKLTNDKDQAFIDNVFTANNLKQFLMQVGLNGGVYGTPFVKIVPDGIIHKLTGDPTYRLIVLDNEITKVFPNPFDVDEPQKYEIVFSVEDTAYMERTSKIDLNDPLSYWLVEHFIMPKGKRKWIPDPEQPPYTFQYPFPPIHHWKNLPSLKASHGCYGSTDAEWATGVQDKHNFANSNISKTIRLNAAPPTIATGFSQAPDIATGPGSLFWTSNDLAKVYNLQANADIDGSRAFAGDLQSAIFQLMREVPPAVIAQLGSGLTNFVMRVVFSDAVDKTDTKRELYGDALLEINRRLLVLNGDERADPGTIEWGDALPVNPTEQIVEDEFLLRNGLDSKKDIAARHGVDLEAIQPDLDAEAAAKNALGGNLLRDFIAGRNQNNA
jgi:hypothetical protein